jgi:hypothetical protein
MKFIKTTVITGMNPHAVLNEVLRSYTACAILNDRPDFYVSTKDTIELTNSAYLEYDHIAFAYPISTMVNNNGIQQIEMTYGADVYANVNRIHTICLE